MERPHHWKKTSKRCHVGLQLQKMLKSQRTRFTTTTSTHEKQDRKLEGCIAARHQPLELRRPDT
ncbi:hypothetical protein YC2023_051526 [Brassica napus]